MDLPALGFRDIGVRETVTGARMIEFCESDGAEKVDLLTRGLQEALVDIAKVAGP